MTKLAEILQLTDSDVEEMRLAAKQSVRRRVLPPNVPTEVYLLWYELSQKLEKLHPIQTRIMRDVLRFSIGDRPQPDFLPPDGRQNHGNQKSD